MTINYEQDVAIFWLSYSSWKQILGLIFKYKSYVNLCVCPESRKKAN